MLASFPASMLNQKPSDLGIPSRFKLDPSRSSLAKPPMPEFTSAFGGIADVAGLAAGSPV
jgi:hypothetical protein